MLLKSKYPVKLALPILLLCVEGGAAVYAAECGVVHYVENKSNGVEVAANDCTANDVALGTSFNLSPGARLWVKSPSSPGAEKHFHAICQNRSLAAITVGVEAATLPWIAPKGLTNCSGWVNNKLSCDGAGGEKNALYCVIAEIESPVYAASSGVERTTSVTLRSLKPIKTHAPAKAAQTAPSFDKTSIIASLQQEAGLCRSLYQPGSRVKIEWGVDSGGRAVNPVASLEAGDSKELGDADKQFAACVVDVVKDFPYPTPAVFTSLAAGF